jgi:hypothetical protein
MTLDKIPEQFDLMWQWHKMCERFGLPEERMHPDQRRETKRAFFGACGQLLILFRNDLAEYAEKQGDDAGVKMLENMLDQVKDWWQQEAAKHISGKN